MWHGGSDTGAEPSRIGFKKRERMGEGRGRGTAFLAEVSVKGLF